MNIFSCLFFILIFSFSFAFNTVDNVENLLQKQNLNDDNLNNIVVQGGDDMLVNVLASAIVNAELSSGSTSPNIPLHIEVPPPPDPEAHLNKFQETIDMLDKPEEVLKLAEKKEKEAKAVKEWIDSASHLINQTKYEEKRVKEKLSELLANIEQLKNQRSEIYTQAKAKMLDKKLENAKTTLKRTDNNIKKLNTIARDILHHKTDIKHVINLAQNKLVELKNFNQTNSANSSQ